MTKQNKYKLVYTKKAELTTRQGETIFLTSKHDAARYSLTPDQYALAKLFDGDRSAKEVQGLYTKATGISLSKADFDEFIENLEKASLLQNAAAPLSGNRRDCPPSLIHAVQIQNASTPLLRGENVSQLPNRSWSRGEVETDDGYEFQDTVDEVMPAETEEERWMRARHAANHSFSTAAKRVKKAGPAGTFGQKVKLVVRIPIGWLMPVANFLALPVRSGAILALILGADLLAGFGLWFNRVDMAQRDIDRGNNAG